MLAKVEGGKLRSDERREKLGRAIPGNLVTGK
jgi:hypothetical protein